MQLVNTEEPILVTPAGMVTVFKAKQLPKAAMPMVFSVSGSKKSVRVHSIKALSPILVTPSGIVILVRFVHLRNALLPTTVTPTGIV